MKLLSRIRDLQRAGFFRTAKIKALSMDNGVKQPLNGHTAVQPVILPTKNGLMRG